MNAWQLVRQVKFLLQTATWPDSPGGPVFASVEASGLVAAEMSDELRPPFALVRVLDATSDENEPALKRERFEVTIVQAHAGDRLGEFGLLGGQRLSAGRSQGRGLLELEERLRLTLDILQGGGAIEVVEESAGAAETQVVEGSGYLTWRAYTFSALVQTARTYPQPAGGNFLRVTKGTPSGGLTPTTVAWQPTPERFDLHPAYTVPVLAARGGLVLVRKVGSVPTSSSDGTTVTITGSVFGTGASDSLTTGTTYYYALFAKHDEFGNASSLRYSAATPSAAVAA